MSLETDYIWMDGEMVEWENAKVHVISHALHYGSAVFEGTRFYETARGPAIFRLAEHTDRLFYSAEAIKLGIHFSREEVNEATKEVVRVNKLKSGYIRPLAFFGEGKMGMRPEGARERLIIAAWPWGKYLADRPLKIGISKYIRIHPKSVIADAKVSGHYVNSILSVQDVTAKGYDEALLLDFEGNIAEGPGENLFIIKDGKLYSPPLGNILNGITRKTIMQVARDDFALEVIEKTLTPKDLFNADEAFYTGTAAEVSPIGFVDDKTIADGQEGEITAKLKKAYFDIVTGKNPKYDHWLFYV